MTNKYDEVLFELKDGTEYATLQADAFRAAMRERDMLRAEREVWGNIAQERNDLRAEVERLRAALQQVVDDAKPMSGGVFWFANLVTLKIAREALGRSKE